MAASKREEEEERSKALVMPSEDALLQGFLQHMASTYLDIPQLPTRKLDRLIGLGLGAASAVVLLLLINTFVVVVNPVIFGLLMIGGGAMGAVGARVSSRVREVPGQRGAQRAELCEGGATTGESPPE